MALAGRFAEAMQMDRSGTDRRPEAALDAFGAKTVAIPSLVGDRLTYGRASADSSTAAMS
jgi:hypothetical protein